MNLTRAFTYVFDDPDWLGKAVVIAALTFASVVLMPALLLGLLPLSILLGYAVEIVSNVRDESRVVLPRWDDFTDRMMRGAGVLVALIVYNLPLLLLGLCFYATGAVSGDPPVQGTVSLITLCCLLPLSLGYVALSWPIMAVGVARYARGGSSNVLYKAGTHFETVQNLGGFSAQWLLTTIIVDLVLAILLVIPCIGWLAFAVLAFPVQAHLLGQYARLIERHERRRPRRA